MNHSLCCQQPTATTIVEDTFSIIHRCHRRRCSRCRRTVFVRRRNNHRKRIFPKRFLFGCCRIIHCITTVKIMMMMMTMMTMMMSPVATFAFPVIPTARKYPSLSPFLCKTKNDVTVATTTTTTTTTTTSSFKTELQCQLLGMNCATPTDFSFSFQGFCRRGGDTDVHADGWGVVFYQDGGIRHFQDVEAASTSPLAQYLGNQSIRTLNMMGHIRYATQGKVNLANVHPFCREMWGIPWCFCHNGEVPLFAATTTNLQSTDRRRQQQQQQQQQQQLPKLKSLCADPIEYYHPIGTTDSEATFCAILNALRCKFTTLPSLPMLHQALQQLCQEITYHDPQNTILNFLLTCGPHTQWVYSWPGQRPGSKVWNGLYYTTREYPFRNVQLCDLDYTVDVSSTTSSSTTTSTTTSSSCTNNNNNDDCVSVIATKPLTDDEEWIELQRNELMVFDQGKPFQTPYELFQLELLGHGLHSTVLQKSSLEVDMEQYDLTLSHFQGECI